MNKEHMNGTDSLKQKIQSLRWDPIFLPTLVIKMKYITEKSEEISSYGTEIGVGFRHYHLNQSHWGWEKPTSEQPVGEGKGGTSVIEK